MPLIRINVFSIIATHHIKKDKAKNLFIIINYLKKLRSFYSSKTKSKKFVKI